MQKIAVTGGAGFIGSEIVRQLDKLGYRVIVVDNLVNGRRENIDSIQSERVEFVQADVRDTGRMAALFKDVSHVFHLACLGVRHSIHSPQENHEVNATATLNLLQIARSIGVSRFIYTSSSEVYGTAQWVPMTELHPTMPHTVYGSSKLAGECYTRAFYRTYDYPTVVIRPFNSFGPRCHHEGDSGEVIPKFMLRCMADKPMVIFGDGNQTRDLTFVGDTARGIITAGFSDACIGKTINIGTQQEIAINDLAKLIASITGKPDAEIIHDAPRPGDVTKLFADATQARQLIGFEPEISLEQGLKTLMQWYLDQGKSPDLLLQDEKVHNWQAKT